MESAASKIIAAILIIVVVGAVMSHAVTGKLFFIF